MTLRRTIAIGFAVFGLLLVGCLAYIAFGDLGRHKQLVEDFVTRHTGRAFVIDGAFELKVLPVLTLRAENVRLANAGWGSKPQMVEVGHLSAQIGFWSMLSGPIDVRAFELRDVNVLLEKGRDGRANWIFREPPAADADEAVEPGSRTGFPLVIEKATLENLRLTYRATGKPDMLARVDAMTIIPGQGGLLDFEGRGKVDLFPISLNGQAGPVDALLAGRDIRLDLSGRLGRLALDVKGGFGQLDPLDGANLQVRAHGEDVGAMLTRFDLPVIANGALDIDLRLTDAAQRTQLALDATAGDLRLKARGSLAGLYLRGSDLQIEASAADAARLAGVFDVTGLPAAPLSLGGRVVPTRKELKFDGVKASLGGVTVQVNGVLKRGRKPGLALDFDAGVENLATWQEKLPACALAAKGRLALDAQRVEIAELQATVGENTLNGSVLLTRAEPRRLEAELASPRIDLTPFFPAPAETPEKPKEKEKNKDKPKEQFLFSDAPLPIRQMSGREARLHAAVGEVVLGNKTFSEVDGIVLLDAKHVEMHARARGSLAGTLNASVSAEPAGPDAANISMKVVLENIRAGIDMKEMQPNDVPPLNLDLQIATHGGTARQMAANSNGHILITQGPGKTRAEFLNAFGGDMLSQLRTRLNPFRAQDPFTQLECTVVRADIVDGAVTVVPVLVQTQKVTVAAKGKLDLHDEQLSFDFDTRPRKGIGVSPGMFTNPFIKLEGTLMHPRIGVGAKGVTSGAFAAATGGLTVLAGGFIDRLKGQANMCARTLKQATLARETD
ncbi:MAG TPA: AsmA family protein [Steroidobacteraceae bacterium]|nr:AsmA family protein [Steroidobacteraceae bacterium]